MRYNNIASQQSMILDTILQILKTYLPIAMGMICLYNYQKIKIQNLIKFFILRTLFSILQFIFLNFFLFKIYIIQLSMIPIYFYLTIYSYSYASSTYDIIIAPLLQFFIEYHTDLYAQVDKQKNRIKVLEQHNKIKVGQVHQLQFLNFFQKIIYNTFNLQNMYLLK